MSNTVKYLIAFIAVFIVAVGAYLYFVNGTSLSPTLTQNPGSTPQPNTAFPEQLAFKEYEKFSITNFTMLAVLTNIDTNKLIVVDNNSEYHTFNLSADFKVFEPSGKPGEPAKVTNNLKSVPINNKVFISFIYVNGEYKAISLSYRLEN